MHYCITCIGGGRDGGKEKDEEGDGEDVEEDEEEDEDDNEEGEMEKVPATMLDFRGAEEKFGGKRIQDQMFTNWKP